MKDRSLTNISASVHQRLLNLARAENSPFNELLQLFAIERFLFRFSRSPPAGRFVTPEVVVGDLSFEDT